MSRLVMSSVWWASHRWRRPRRMRALTGPAAMVATVVAWGFLVVVGFLLVYLPLVTVGTLGFGDIVPRAGWLRVVRLCRRSSVSCS